MKSRNKFLLIILLSFIFLLFFNICNVKATVEVQDGENTLYFPDFPENVLNANSFVLLEKTTENNNDYYLFFSDKEFRHHTTCKNNNSSDCLFASDYTTTIDIYGYVLNNNSWQNYIVPANKHILLNHNSSTLLLSNRTIKSLTGYTCGYNPGPTDNGIFFNTNFSLGTITIKYDNVNYTIPEIPNYIKNGYENYIIVSIGNPTKNKFYLLVSNKPFKYYQKCSNFYNKYNADCIPYDNSNDYYYYDGSTIGWENKGKFKSNVHGISGFNINWYYLLYSNEDILIYEDENNNNTEELGTFFTVPVQETTTIPVLVETVEQIPTIMTTVMKIIIPIGLIILGIGLLIYLIKRVIYSSL